MSEAPRVELDWRAMFCHRHLTRLVPQDAWPDGAAAAMLSMFDVAAADESLVELGAGDPQRLNSLFRELGPMCCFVGPVAFLHVEHRFVERMIG